MIGGKKKKNGRERAEDGEVESGLIGRRSRDGIFFFRGRRRGEIERDL